MYNVTQMRAVLVVSAFMIATFAWAAQPVPLSLSPVDCADTEVTTNVVVSGWQRGAAKFYRPRIPGWEFPLGMPGTGMKVPVYVGPMDVSFEGIALSERPCETGLHTGFYDHPSEMRNWSQTHDCRRVNRIILKGGEE